MPLQCFAVRITVTACVRSRLFPVQQVCIRIQLHAAQHLPGASLRPPGSICAALPSLPQQQPAAAAGCLHGSSLHSHAAASRSSQHALHSALKGSVCAAMLWLPRHQPASARSCTRSTLLQQRRRAAAMPKRVQAKRRLRTTATLTLWAAVQPGAFLLFRLRILEWLNWRLALLVQLI